MLLSNPIHPGDSLSILRNPLYRGSPCKTKSSDSSPANLLYREKPEKTAYGSRVRYRWIIKNLHPCRVVFFLFRPCFLRFFPGFVVSWGLITFYWRKLCRQIKRYSICGSLSSSWQERICHQRSWRSPKSILNLTGSPDMNTRALGEIKKDLADSPIFRIITNLSPTIFNLSNIPGLSPCKQSSSHPLQSVFFPNDLTTQPAKKGIVKDAAGTNASEPVLYYSLFCGIIQMVFGGLIRFCLIILHLSLIIIIINPVSLRN